MFCCNATFIPMLFALPNPKFCSHLIICRDEKVSKISIELSVEALSTAIISTAIDDFKILSINGFNQRLPLKVTITTAVFVFN